jgi:hypothetical protein
MSKLIVNEIEKYDAGQLTITTGTNVSIGSDLTVGGALGGTLSTAAQPNITSLGTLSSLAVSGNLTVDTNTLFVDASSNNVGIGTSSPSTYGKFAVSGTGSIINATSSSGTAAIGLWEASVSRFFLATLGGSKGLAFIDGDGSSERMRIDSSGNVGIGTSNPGDKLEIYSGTYHKIKTFFEGSYTSGLKFSDYNGGIRYDALNDRLTLFANYPTSGAEMTFETAGSERMRITGGGYLKVSNTGIYSYPTQELHNINSNQADVCAAFNNTNAAGDGIITILEANNTSEYFFRGYSIGQGGDNVFIYSNGNIINRNNSYGVISDAKLKENITDATPKLDDLLQVKIRNFNYIGSEVKQLGVVAQELEEVFPLMIDESPDFEEQEVTDEEGNVTTQKVDLGTTTKSVKMSVFVPIIIKAMQEQQEIINDLKARIETLENK